MSGWIKLEKDLREDARFARMVDALIAREGEAVHTVTQARYISNAASSRVLGSLAQLWMYADSHVREDDTLDMGADEINQLVGFEGFADLMPTDWLEIVDSHCVKLPGFHEHNGTAAKKKAQGTKRVALHRIRKSVTAPEEVKRTSVTPALPDQTKTRLDQDKSKSASEVSRGTESWDRAERVLAEYPAGLWKPSDKLVACKHIDRILDESMATEDALKALTIAFREQQQACGNIGSQFIPRPSRHFDPVTGDWRGPFPLPASQASESPERQRMREAEAKESAQLAHRATASGFRGRMDGESTGAYRTLLQRHEDARRDQQRTPSGLASIASLLPARASA